MAMTASSMLPGSPDHTTRVSVLACFVPGRPVSQGSLSQGSHGKLYWSNNTAVRQWRALFCRIVSKLLPDDWSPLDCAVGVDIGFIFKRPVSRQSAVFHTIPIDIDKGTRLVLDGLTDAFVVKDDARVSEIHCVKLYTTDDWPDEGIVVRVWRLSNLRAAQVAALAQVA